MIGLVWAQARDRVIGAGGAVPFDLPEDRRRFAATTRGAVVVMGRATWDSLPVRYRPLPGRRNVVLTRQDGWSAPGAERAGSLPAALDLVGEGDVWVIGGAEVYAAALALAVDGAGSGAGGGGSGAPEVVEVTEVDVTVGPDHGAVGPDHGAVGPDASDPPAGATAGAPVRAPVLDAGWAVVALDPPQGWHVSTTGLRHRFVTHRRVAP